MTKIKQRGLNRLLVDSIDVLRQAQDERVKNLMHATHQAPHTLGG